MRIRCAPACCLLAGFAMLVAASPAAAAIDFNGPANYPAGDGIEDLTIGDFDGDGNNDVATPNINTDDGSLLLGSDIGVLDAPINIPQPNGTYQNPQAIAAGHFDADSDLDLIMGWFLPETALMQGGTGETFGAPVLVGTGGFARSIEVADFNEDTNPDLAVANLSATTVQVALGNGDGTFNAPTGLPLGGTTPVDVAVDDFDGDTNLDLVTANFDTDNLSVLLGNGDGSFDAASNLATGDRPNSVASGALDSGSVPDLAISHFGDEDVRVRLGAGDGSFGSASIIDPGFVPQTLAIEDFDADTQRDIAVAGHAGGLSLLPGEGDGSFAPQIDFATGGGPGYVKVGDLNDDADPDLAVAKSTGDNVSVFLNALNAPPRPTLADLDPDSPANDNSVLVKGTAQAGSTVRIYGSSDCSGSVVASGPQADFGAAGIGVSVSDDTSTALSATATNTVGVSSRCSTNSLTYVEDSTPPETTIDSGPSGPTTDFTPTFAFSSNEPGSSFECRFDAEAFAPCTSPHTPGADLSESAHSFEVRATDPASNPDPSAASRSFTVAVPPETTIDSGPSGPTPDSTPTFGFSSNEPGSSFVCRFDAEAFAPCTSPHTRAPALPDGAHTFEARATDPASNPDPSPASRSFVVDTVPPGISISSGPSGTSNQTQASFGFAADEAAVTFECQLDGGGFEACTSGKTYTALSAASHSFDVRGTDAAGNPGTAVASRSWTIDPGSATNTTSGTANPGGSVTTDPADAGPTTADPVTAAVYLPAGGTVTLVQEAATTAPPTGFTVLGEQFQISAPAATAGQPLLFTFRLDASAAAGIPLASLTVLRDGVAAADCAVPGIANPDPCVTGRETLPDGDLRLTVASTHASTWNIARRPEPSCIVPKLKGLKLKQARKRLAAANCALGRVSKTRSPARKRGRVISQRPGPGKTPAAGSKVAVVVGRG